MTDLSLIGAWHSKFVLSSVFSSYIDMDEFLDMTMDEDKENQTPSGLQWERNVDFVPQCNRNQEREEQELQQALTQSLMERVRQKTTCLSFSNGAVGNFH